MLTFIETKLFSRLVGECLTDEEYAALQWRRSEGALGRLRTRQERRSQGYLLRQNPPG